MKKQITNIFINSAVAVFNKDANFDGSRVYSLNINTPPITISNKANLKLANLCHTGTGHADNIIIMKIDGIQTDYARYIANDGGKPTLVATTFNNTRNLYEENDLPLIRQTINEVKILLSTLAPSISSFTGFFSITTAGSGYLSGQILTFIGGGGDNITASIVASSGAITSVNALTYGNSYTSTPTLSTSINGSGAILTANLIGSAISSITITNAGAGYKANQALAFTGGGGSGANITIASVNATGGILTFTITSGGTGFTSAPSVSVSSTTQTQTAVIAPQMNLGVITDGVVNTLNFCISLKIEEDINEY